MCQMLIQDVINWLRDDPERRPAEPGRRLVQFCLTSNEVTVTPGINLVSYAVGELRNYNSGWAFWGPLENHIQYRWERIWGSGVQAFNDRYVREHLSRQNFDITQQDSVDLAVTLSTPGPNGTPYHVGVELTLVTWGGDVLSLTDYCCGEGILFAYADGSPDRNGVNKVGYTITFKNVTRD